MAQAPLPDTFPRLLLHHAQWRDKHPALREKDLGIWQTWTWAQVAEEVKKLAAGLHVQGFRRGDHVAIIGENRPRMYFAMMAVQSLGGVPVPMSQDANAAEMVYVFHNAEIAYAIVEDQEQVDKMLEVREQHTLLKHIYYDDSRGLEWKRLPIMVRALDEHLSEGLGKALATVLRDKNFVLVASTDLSHFFKQDAALVYDRAMLGEIEAFNPAGAFDLDRSRKGFACGLGAFTAILWAARRLGADKVRVLRHATSANITGDYSSVVGYGAAAILKSK